MRQGILVILLFSSLLTVRAQLTTVNATMSNYSPEVLNLGSNGLAVIGGNKKEAQTVVRIDGEGKLLWQKDYTAFIGKSVFTMPASSASGNDIYILAFDAIDTKGGGKNLWLTHIDSKTGESYDKKWTIEKFGHVLTMYANDKYLFVMATQHPMSEPKIEKEPGLRLYRFDKITLEMNELQHEMNNPWPQPRVFWQVIRVENDFTEGYVVKAATGQSVTLALARFDNDGKKLFMKEVTMELKSSFTRDSNGDMPLGPGISRYMYKQNVLQLSYNGSGYSVMINPMTTCYLLYHPEAKSYFAYGYCGPGEQKKASTKHTGIYVGKMDSTFTLVAFKEHQNVSEIASHKKISMNAASDTRMISGYVGPGNNLILELSPVEYLHLQITGDDLAINKTVASDVSVYKISGNRMSGSASVLATQKEVAAKNKRTTALCYVCTATRQYAIVHAFYENSLEVISEPLR